MTYNDKHQVINDLRETREKINAWRTFQIEKTGRSDREDEMLEAIDDAIQYVKDH